MNTSSTETITRDLHPDLLTGEPGSHPVGTGLGAAAGGASGAAIGAISGPVGAALGAVIGAVVGGFAGKGVAEGIDPTAEEAFWRENHRNQPYVIEGTPPFEEYAMAYRTGYTGYRVGRSFVESEEDLRKEYEIRTKLTEVKSVPEEVDPATVPGTMQNNLSTYPLRWEDARDAVHAAFERAREKNSPTNPPRRDSF